MHRLAMPSIVLCVLGSACSSEDPKPVATTDAGKDVSVVADTAGQKNDGVAPADISADAPPGALGDAVGRDPLSGMADLPLDLSCVGTPMPVKGETTERTAITAELGDETALVPETNLEIFYSNTVEGTPDVTGTTAMTTAELKAKFPAAGFFATRSKKTGFIETVAYDWWFDTPKAIFAIANPDKLTAIQILAGGSDYVHKAGTSRLVVQLNDCKQHDISNAHVVIEVDGKVVTPVTKGEGIRRNYFSDNELPSKATVTSRSGVVAFLGVPGTASVRLIAYGKVGGAVVPIAIRSLKPVADGVVTALVTPFLEP